MLKNYVLSEEEKSILERVPPESRGLWSCCCVNYGEFHTWFGCRDSFNVEWLRAEYKGPISYFSARNFLEHFERLHKIEDLLGFERTVVQHEEIKSRYDSGTIWHLYILHMDPRWNTNSPLSSLYTYYVRQLQGYEPGLHPVTGKKKTILTNSSIMGIDDKWKNSWKHMMAYTKVLRDLKTKTRYSTISPDSHYQGFYSLWQYLYSSSPVARDKISRIWNKEWLDIPLDTLVKEQLAKDALPSV